MERKQIGNSPQFQPTLICPSKREKPLLVPGRVFGQILTGIRESRPFFESKEAAKTYLEDRITERRNQFIAEYKEKKHGTQLLTYEPALDREVYKELKEHKHVHEDAYQDVLRGLNSYTKFQVETFIGERLNVGLSKFRYDLRFSDGKGILHGQGMEEPLLQMISRGRDCRNEVADDIDHPRQVAEVTQFEKIQEVLGNPDTVPGTTVVSFSPPGKEGSAYSHNFYDVFILKEDEEKERYVEARRYASGLSIEDSLQKAEALQPGFTQEMTPDEEHVDAFLISRPVVLKEGHEYFNKPDELHKNLQGDKEAMSYDDFQTKIVKDEIFSEMVHYYLQTLEEDPNNKRLLDRTLNALMNRADEVVGLRTVTSFSRRDRRDIVTNRGALPIIAHINDYGTQKVRQTATGCGSSGAFGSESKGSAYGSSRLPSNMSKNPLSMAEDSYGKRTFSCPDCGEINLRPYGELISECQHCKSKKVAC